MSSIQRDKKLWIVGALLVLAGAAQAAFELRDAGPRAMGLGGAGVALTGDSWGGLRNPALIHGTPLWVGACWSQQFGLPELSREQVSVAGTTARWNIGVNGSAFGSDLYRETSFDLLAAYPVSSELTLGISAGLRSLDIQNYDGAQGAAIGIGFLAMPIEGIALGGAWQNLNRGRLSHLRDKLPESATAGVAIDLSAQSRAVIDLVAERHFPVEGRFGIESQVSKYLVLRVGARAEPFRPAGGFSIKVRRWIFHYGGDLHPDLGASHSVGLGMRF